MSGADKARSYALSFDGLDSYEWAEVPSPWEPPDSDPRDGDCSGFCYAVWRTGGVSDTVLGGRMTAHDYYRRGHHISSSEAVCGDYIVLLGPTGHAHHIIMCVGRGDTMEARGEAYGYERHTVAYCMARLGAVCMRMVGIHEAFGDLSRHTYSVRWGAFAKATIDKHLDKLASLHGARYDRAPTSGHPKDRDMTVRKWTGYYNGVHVQAAVIGPSSYLEIWWLRKRLVYRCGMPREKVRIL